MPLNEIKFYIIQNILINDNFKFFLNTITIKDIDNLNCYIHNKMFYNLIELIDKIINKQNIDLNNIIISITQYDKLCEKYNLNLKNILLETKLLYFNNFTGGNGYNDYINTILSMKITYENINFINSNLKIGSLKRMEIENSYFIINVNLLNPYIKKYPNIFNDFKIIKKGNLYFIPIKNIIDTKFIIRIKNNYYLNLFSFQKQILLLKEKIIHTNLKHNNQLSNTMNIIVPKDVMQYLFTIAYNNINEFNKILNILNIHIYKNKTKKTFIISKIYLDTFNIKIKNGKFIFPPNFRHDIIIKSHMDYITIPKTFIIDYLNKLKIPIEKLKIRIVKKNIYLLPYKYFIYLNLKINNNGTIIYPLDIKNKLIMISNNQSSQNTKIENPTEIHIKPESLQNEKNQIEPINKPETSQNQIELTNKPETSQNEIELTNKPETSQNQIELTNKPETSQNEINKIESINKPIENLYSIFEKILDIKNTNDQLNDKIKKIKQQNIDETKTINQLNNPNKKQIVQNNTIELDKEIIKNKNESILVRTIPINNI